MTVQEALDHVQRNKDQLEESIARCDKYMAVARNASNRSRLLRVEDFQRSLAFFVTLNDRMATIFTQKLEAGEIDVGSKLPVFDPDARDTELRRTLMLDFDYLREYLDGLTQRLE